MGTTVTCDYLIEGEACGTKAPVKYEVESSNRVFTLLSCRDHTADVESGLMALGFIVSVKTDDKLRKGYITESGKPFSAQEAREWLAANGHNVPLAGRLSGELIEVYRTAN